MNPPDTAPDVTIIDGRDAGEATDLGTPPDEGGLLTTSFSFSKKSPKTGGGVILLGRRGPLHPICDALTKRKHEGDEEDLWRATTSAFDLVREAGLARPGSLSNSWLPSDLHTKDEGEDSSPPIGGGGEDYDDPLSQNLEAGVG